ncbi:MAG: hypothetical protein H6646_01635 [Anaerolineales bacterium]|nr:hypothetical protein [Anaerolineales bacterium]MCO5246996.1 hypothetical protein [Anaerolineae bacterium]
MVTQALKELIALFNVLCGGLLFLVLLVYLVRARPRRAIVALTLLAMILLCLLNSIVVYFVV